MLRNIFTTNDKELEPLNRGWIIGDGKQTAKFPELFSKSTFVKFSEHNPDDPETGQRVDPDSCEKSSLVVLLSGQIQHKFYDENLKVIQETNLSNDGEMVYYGPNVKHTWKVLKPSTKVLTIQFDKVSKN